MTIWDPDHYLRYADHRTRPGVELIARIPDVTPNRIVDLGCGTGHLTALLADRFPTASVVGIDSSHEMIEVARAAHPELTWEVADLASWDPPDRVDVVYSNAALHWLDDHEALFRRIRSWTTDGGAIAVQMPANWDAPTHRIPARILDRDRWPEAARSALLRDRLARPADYRRWLQPATVDLWTTTYHQILDGEDAVWQWVTGSVLRPVLERLGGPDRERFADLCRRAYADAYPPEPDGTTMMPFQRLFVIAAC